MLWNATNGQKLGGSVISATKKAEYGRAPINIDQESDLLFDVEDKSNVDESWRFN